MSFLLNMTTDFSQFPIKFQAGINLFDAITEKTWYTNSAINFFLYILSGTKFRKDLMQLFGYCQQRWKHIGFDMNITKISTSSNIKWTDVLQSIRSTKNN